MRIEAKVETISPDRAQKLVDRTMKAVNDGRLRLRHVKRYKVEEYSKDMTAGRWQLNGEPLILTPDGIVLDGMHRLNAIIKSGVTLQVLVARGAADDAFHTIDTGAVRTGGDLLTIAGQANGSDLACALAVVWRYDQGSGRLTSAAWADRPTKPQLFQVLEAHPDLPGFVARASGLEKLMSGGLAAALWYLFAKRDHVLAGGFFEALRSGTSMQPGDPVTALRERLYQDRARRPRPTMQVTAELIVRAWNNTRQGKTMSKVQRGKETKDGKQPAIGIR